MDTGLVIALLGFVLLARPLLIYNELVSKRNKVARAFAGIDAQLKLRWDLIPNLVSTVKGFAVHERDLLTALVNARNSAAQSPARSSNRANSEAELTQLIPQTLLLTEKYPKLRSSSHFLNLQRNLTEVESQIAAARRSYDAAVLTYNDSVDMFPSSLVAKAFDFERQAHFDLTTTERRSHAVTL